MLKLNLSKLPIPLAEAARETLPLLDLCEDQSGIVLLSQRDPEGLKVSYSSDGDVVISYKELCEFFRGLSHVKRLERTGEAISEKQSFKWLSYMVDVARNAVLKLPAMKRLIRYLAINGFNDLMLYLEDVFEMPDYPYFGYMRGKYTLNELKELVEYGERFGVTLTPCIQSLGHYSNMLRWPCFSSIRDSADVLYVGKDETYEFLDKLFATLCSVFKTRRFNIGMDEAGTLGRGRMLEEKGLLDQGELMTLHLHKIKELCRKHGIQPLIWSDMFFRPYDPSHEYYTDTVIVPQEAIDGVPEDFTLVYWNYHSCERNQKEKDVFNHVFDQHMRFKNPIAYAGASWRFSGFAPHNMFSMSAENFHLNACLERGIKDITLTAWSNGGGEASHFVTMPIITLYGEKLYTAQRNAPDISERFFDLYGISLEDFLSLDLPDRVPDSPELLNSSGRHPVTYLLYNDCLGGKMDRLVSSPQYGDFYRSLIPGYERLSEHKHFGYIFRTQAALCKVMANKATVSYDLRAAYKAKDKAALALLCQRLTELSRDLSSFIDVCREQWLTDNKVTGFECLEARFGSLKQRALGAKAIVEAYLAGEIDAIEPLDEPMLYHDCRPDDSTRSKVCATNGYYDIVQPSFFM